MNRARVSKRGALSLLEVAVAAVVICILIAVALPAYAKLRARAQRAQCTANLRSLHVAANLYIQENRNWPQIRLDGEGELADSEYASQWIAALGPFGATTKTWICPTIENLMQSRDDAAPETSRTDYFAMTFDDKPTTPHQWPRQPWFVERGDVHGNGNLMVLTDGSITDLKSIAAGAQR